MERYADGRGGARVRMLVRGDSLLVRANANVAWRYDEDDRKCVCGEEEMEKHVLFECPLYERHRIEWNRVWRMEKGQEDPMNGVLGFEVPSETYTSVYRITDNLYRLQITSTRSGLDHPMRITQKSSMADFNQFSESGSTSQWTPLEKSQLIWKELLQIPGNFSATDVMTKVDNGYVLIWACVKMGSEEVGLMSHEWQQKVRVPTYVERATLEMTWSKRIHGVVVVGKIKGADEGRHPLALPIQCTEQTV
ncbi:hypothetical protein CAPTEDRAFT_218298 [Capitella teleta]|uniref:Uncharacterized protein n=1 Tax=Capitella teleta TaxID=283909 RepID=R7U4H7_CAPTE|nr:hypothetical protein CAPTEDRAFT_218298 [Capitella teleta]|eukprot:ELT98591.1 hypothetical protein CAPTEDRAFT_218298 [Capitella teleta]